MPYTLTMGLIWFVLALAVGVLVGWLLRSVVATRQLERARSAHADAAELERLRRRTAELESAEVERDRLRSELERERTPVVPAADTPTTTTATTPTDAPAPERPVLDEASAVLGRPVVADDLTVIDGIGPQIADLCDGIGISTWNELADTEVSLLRTMLHDAGQRFRSHDPATWPEQARLLASGDWQAFVDLTTSLDPTNR